MVTRRTRSAASYRRNDAATIHYYLGDPLEVLKLRVRWHDRSTLWLGPDLRGGQLLQLLIPAATRFHTARVIGRLSRPPAPPVPS